MRAKLLRRVAVHEKDINFQGLSVTIEWPKGSTRTGVDKDGKDWYRKMHADYGYVQDTRAKGDGEDLDVYIGPNKEAPTAYVIDQLKDDGSFDEPKVMLGFDSLEEARDNYLEHYPEGWENTNLGDITPVTVERLAEMVDAEQEKNQEQVMQEADDSEWKMTKALGLSDTDEYMHEINRAKDSGALRDALEELGFADESTSDDDLTSILFKLPFDDGLTVMETVMEETPVDKVGRFLTVAEVMDTFYTKVLPKPGYQQALKELGGGKDYKELDQDTRNAICDRGRHLEVGQED